ncbi:MAG: hypothetical protein WAM71_00165 [Candidatus Korobacteraceae bacterium]
MRTATLAVILLAAIGAFGEATDCLNPSVVQADDRLVISQFAGTSNGLNPTYWYAFYGQAGHSYSAEFVPTVDNENTTFSIIFIDLYVWGPNDIGGLQQNGCFGGSTVAYYATQTYSPVLAKGKYGAGQRISFIATTAGLNIVSVTNRSAQGTYSYRFTDTTLFNPRWSTWSGYDTSWGFTNMSDMPITGTMYLYLSNNQLLEAVPMTLNANQQVFRSTYSYDLNLHRNQDGYAIFAHNGPPGAILADAILQGPNSSVAVPSKFESRYTH